MYEEIAQGIAFGVSLPLIIWSKAIAIKIFANLIKLI